MAKCSDCSAGTIQAQQIPDTQWLKEALKFNRAQTVDTRANEY
jgi:hypothetical protein